MNICTEIDQTKCAICEKYCDNKTVWYKLPKDITTTINLSDKADAYLRRSKMTKQTLIGSVSNLEDDLDVILEEAKKNSLMAKEEI